MAKTAFSVRFFAIIAFLIGGAATALAQVAASPASISFGSVGLGTEGKASMDITNNATSSAATITGFVFSSPIFGLREGEFPQTIAPKQTTRWSIGVIPTAAGTANGTLTITVQNGSPVVVPLKVTAVQNTGIASLSTTNISFGNVALGTTVTQPVTVTNTGTEAFNVLEVYSYAPFTVTGFSGTETLLNPGASLNLTVSYSPWLLGAITGFLTIEYDLIPATGASLSGTGVSPPGVAITNFPTLPSAIQGAAYQSALQATGGTPPYTWQITSGSVPGLSLDSSTGVLSGTVPSSATIQNYSLQVQVQDSSTPTHMQAANTLTVPVNAPTGANCNNISWDVAGTQTPLVPINDLGTGTYAPNGCSTTPCPAEGGLYPNGSNVDPEPHLSDGISIGQSIVPLNISGIPDPASGVLGLLAIGPSTTFDAFNQLIPEGSADPAVNRHVVFVNGAIPDETADQLSEQNSAFWNAILNYIIPFAGVTNDQIVVAWVDIVDSLSSTFPADAQQLQGELEMIAQELHTNLPNLKVAYFGSLNYTGYSNGVAITNPEPQGYDGGFADKWAIQDQINGTCSISSQSGACLNYNSALGPVLAPWMAWGPYYWANGLLARQDGTTWSCEDLSSDGVHPSLPGGINKENEFLLNFLETDPTASPWFLAPTAPPAVTLSPSSLTFATQNIGTTSPAQSVTLTNSGGATLSITSITLTGTNPGDFAQTNNCGSSVAANASCTINVTFTPTASGTRTASVSIADNASGSPQFVGLTGTGAGGGSPAVTLKPSQLLFAKQVIHTTSPPEAVTLTNTGTGTLDITSIAIGGTDPGDFAQTNNCGSTVAAGANCTINVTFTPQGGGSQTATLSITDNAAGSPQSLTMTGVGSSVQLSPASLTFGPQSVGTTSPPQSITLTNEAKASLSITSISITGTNAEDFAQTNNCGTTVAAGASCTVNVTFTPTTTGTLTASISVSDNGSGSPQTASLTGTGGGPGVTLSPTSLTFSSQNIGTTSPAQSITLTNSGNATLSVTSITLTGANPGDFAQTNNCGTSVAAGADCTISVTFTPTATGTRTASVTIADNASGSPQSVGLTGTGTGIPAVTLSPTSLTFPTTSVLSTSPTQVVTLTNGGTAALSITSIGITGAKAANFAQTNTCGTSVAAGGNCSISVTFTPTGSGNISATLSLADNASGSPQTVALTGVGTSLGWNPASLTFASQTVGTTSPAQTITLTSLFPKSTMTIDGITITGTNAGDFAQTNNCPTNLGPKASCTVNVTFTPTATGTRTAAVTITDNAGGSPQTVPLTGTGM
jgi:hypothetical protein